MQNDAIFPLFVAQKLPVGVAGFLIAAIFSAAMSSLDSGMNSMATSFVTDFYRRFKPDKSEHTYLTFARGFTLLAGLSATAFALYIVTVDIQSAQLLFSSTVGLLSSGLAGLFILGIFTRRANGIGVFIGAIVSALVLYFVKTYTPIHFILYAFYRYCRLCYRWLSRQPDHSGKEKILRGVNLLHGATESRLNRGNQNSVLIRTAIFFSPQS